MEEQVQCPRCEGTGINPEPPNNICLCCKGEKTMTKVRRDAILKIREDLSSRLRLLEVGE